MIAGVHAMFKRLQTKRDRTPKDLMFVSRYGKAWQNRRTVFDNACERAKIRDFHFHDPRDTFASQLAMTGTQQKGLMQLLGHRDSKMTDRYTRLSYRQTAVQTLPSFANLEALAESSEQPESIVVTLGRTKVLQGVPVSDFGG